MNPDMEQAGKDRLEKSIENSKRAEKMTGVYPFTSEGWEKVAVLLMDKLEDLKRTDSQH